MIKRAFLGTEVTLACFRQHGTTPDAMEELMGCVRNGSRLPFTSFNSRVGKWSSTQDVVGDLISKLRMFDVVAVGNNSSRDTLCRMGLKCHTNRSPNVRRKEG